MAKVDVETHEKERFRIFQNAARDLVAVCSSILWTNHTVTLSFVHLKAVKLRVNSTITHSFKMFLELEND